MTDPLHRPVQPLTVAVLVGVASLFSFILGGGFWAGVLETRLDNTTTRLEIAERRLDKLGETVSATNLTLVQIQGQLTYLVRQATPDIPSRLGEQR